MAKGYMIFVDGAGTPQVIHPTIEAAIWQMKQLAEKNPGKEIFLFQLLKRCTHIDGAHAPLPWHIPADFENPERLKLDRLDERAGWRELLESAKLWLYARDPFVVDRSKP